MAIDVREGVLTIEGDNGQRIGIGSGGPAARFDVDLRAGASRADMTVGIGTKAPCGWFEVRSGGAVGVKVVDLL